MFRGVVEIYKIEDGVKTKIYQDNNIVTEGMGYSIANLFTEQEDQPIENFQVGYFQLGTSAIPLEELEVPTAFYELSAGLQRTDYGSNLDTEIKELIGLGSISPCGINETKPEDFGQNVSLGFTKIQSSYNQIAALRSPTIYTQDTQYSNTTTTTNQYTDATSSIANFAVYRENGTQYSKYRIAIVSSLAASGKVAFYSGPQDLFLYTAQGTSLADKEVFDLTDLNISATNVAINKNLLYFIRKYEIGGQTSSVVEEYCFVDPAYISPLENLAYGYISSSVISRKYVSLYGFQGFQAVDLKSTGKDCLLVRGVENSTGNTKFYLYGSTNVSNFRKTRNFIISLNNAGSFATSAWDIYPLEYTMPTTETRLCILTKLPATHSNSILQNSIGFFNVSKDDESASVAVPDIGLLSLINSTRKALPMFLQPPNYVVEGVSGTLPVGVSVVDIQLTQPINASLKCFGLALFSNGMVSSWGGDTGGLVNNPFISIPSQLQGSCTAIRLSGTKAHGLKSNGKVYTWGSQVDNPITFNSLINPSIVEPDLTSYAFAEIPESRKITHKDRSNRYRIFLDKDMAPNKTITELGLFIKNPNVDYKTDKPILAAYKVLDNPIQKTNEFEILIDWTITVVDQTE